MDFYDVAEKRRTVRDFDPQATMDAETIQRIISAGLQAPSNDHLRDWHFVVIRDKSVILKLIEIIPKGISDQDMEALLEDWHLNDPVQQECYRNAVPKQYRMFADASCVVVPLFRQKTDILHPKDLSHLNGFASIWCSIENILLAATAEDYCCTLRIPLGNEEEWTRKVLRFPVEYRFPCIIAIGKKRADAKEIQQKEYSMIERIHYDRWE